MCVGCQKAIDVHTDVFEGVDVCVGCWKVAGVHAVVCGSADVCVGCRKVAVVHADVCGGADVLVGCQKVVCILLYCSVCIFSHPTHLLSRFWACLAAFFAQKR